jgi:Tfp pilus assembly protein PilO
MKLARSFRLPQVQNVRLENPLPRLRWGAYRALDRMGQLGAIELALLVAIGGYFVSYQMPRGDALAQEKTELRAELKKLKPQAHKVDNSPAAKLRGMLNSDPAAQKLAVFEALKQYGMDAKESTYRKDDEVKGKLERWSMSITMTGRYSDLDRALHVFAEQPLLRIDALSMERPKIEDDKLNINLRISLLGADA